ncbi:MAG: hypothetical protein LUC39_00555 [Clostridiales bacterium]|nr:hypothetical protein [Clostridiales bacterium]
MPIIVGFTGGKVFDCNSYVTAVIGGALVYPDLVTAVSAEESIKFLGISVASASIPAHYSPSFWQDSWPVSRRSWAKSSFLRCCK